MYNKTVFYIEIYSEYVENRRITVHCADSGLMWIVDFEKIRS